MRCKNCRIKFSQDEAIYQGIYYFCSTDCKYQFCSQKKSIKEKSTNFQTKKIAKFTQETKALILIRDKSCIISGCDKGISDYHHVYYGSQAQYDEGRNDVSCGVGLCRDCHHEIHHGIKGLSQEYRQYCIDYLHTYYKKKGNFGI